MTNDATAIIKALLSIAIIFLATLSQNAAALAAPAPLPEPIRTRPPARASATSLNVVVKDESEHQLSDAEVTITGLVSTGARTAAAGVSFNDLPPGTYSVRVQKEGYVSKTVTIEVSATGYSLTLSLRKTPGFKRIGVTSTGQSSPGEISPDVTHSLESNASEALSDIPGVFLLGQNSTSPKNSELSIGGRDPSQTAVSIAGIPLNIPGVAANLTGLDLDLFDDAQITNQNSAGGGSINFPAAKPTRSWQTFLDSSYGSFERDSMHLTTQGTGGNTGVAVVLDTRDLTSPLDGQTFQDQSGLNYRHDGGNRQRGASIVLEQRIGNNHLSTTFISSTDDGDILCTVWSGRLPCGFGPGNYFRNSFTLTSIGDSIAVGSVSLAASYYKIYSHALTDLDSARISGEIVPTDATTRSSLSGASFEAGLTSGKSTFDGKLNFGITSSGSAWLSSSAASNLANTTRFASGNLADRIGLNDGLSVMVSGQATHLSGTATSLIGSFGLIKKWPADATASISAFAGNLINPDGSSDSLTPPSALEYDCTTRTAFGLAPGAPHSLNSTLGLSGTYKFTLPIGHFSLELVDEQQENASLTTLEDGRSIQKTFPPDYDPQVEQTANGLCGGQPSDSRPVTTYFSAVIPGLTLRYQQVNIRADWKIATHIRENASLALLGATASATTTSSPAEAVIVSNGKQILGVPVLSGYSATTWTPGSENNSDVLVGVRYVGFNNAQNVPPHFLVNLGLRQRVHFGQISLLISNVFNTDSGSFSRFGLAAPILARDGAIIPMLGTPEMPRRAEVSYSIGAGRNVVARDHLLTHIADLNNPDDILVPGTLITRWPLLPPRDPFQRNSSSICTADEAEISDKIISDVRNASSRVTPNTGEWIKASSTQPGTVILSENRSASAIVHVTTTRLSILNAVSHCVMLHVGKISDAEHSNLPFPSSATVTHFEFFFAKSVGLYYVDIPKSESLIRSVRLYALPSSVPSDPFALSNSCPSELRETAQRVLAGVRAYFDGSPRASADNLAIQSRTAAGLHWFKIASDDIGVFSAVVACGHVSSGPRGTLATMGLGADLPTDLNYAPAIGLYIIQH